MSSNSNPVSAIVSETIAYTFAEIHVHGIIYGITIVTKHAFRAHLEEGAIALVMFAGFGMVAAHHHFRTKRQLARAKLSANHPVWVTHNF